MHKLAIFVEGQTESQFVDELVRQIANAGTVRIEHVFCTGGAKAPRRLIQLNGTDKTSGHRFYVQIYCSANDSRVASDVLEQYDGLVRQNFAGIISLRDVYPSSPNKIPAIQRAMAHGQRTLPLRVHNCLSVMEVEAWFLAEVNHFERLSTAITPAAIAAKLGFDPGSENVEARLQPSRDLHEAYTIGGLRYDKSRKNVARTVTKLDYEHLYIGVRQRVPSLANLIGHIEGFLGGMSWNNNVPAIS